NGTRIEDASVAIIAPTVFQMRVSTDPSGVLLTMYSIGAATITVAMTINREKSKPGTTSLQNVANHRPSTNAVLCSIDATGPFVSIATMYTLEANHKVKIIPGMIRRTNPPSAASPVKTEAPTAGQKSGD